MCVEVIVCTVQRQFRFLETQSCVEWYAHFYSTKYETLPSKTALKFLSKRQF